MWGDLVEWGGDVLKGLLLHPPDTRRRIRTPRYSAVASTSDEDVSTSVATYGAPISR